MNLKNQQPTTINLAFVLALLLASSASAAGYYPAQKYATQCTIYFTVYDSNSPWRVYETAPAAADVHVFQDGASEARAANAVTDLGRTMSLVLTAAEMTAALVTVDVNDASDPPLFGDAVLYIPTFGHASAYYPVDWSDASPPVDVASMQAGTVTAAAIATGAFDADALATSAVDEILDNTLSNNKVKQSLSWYVQRGGGGDPLAITGTAQAGGTSNTLILAADTPGADDAFVPCAVTLLTGTGAWAIRTGVAYNSTTKALTILDTWPGTPPDATTTYKIEYAPSSALAAEGVAQAGTTNTAQLAAGDVGADNLTGLVQLVSGAGAGPTIYSVRDSYDANDTIVITGVWAGATPDTTTYYKFTPAGGQVADASTPTPGLSVGDVQSALTAQGYTATLATNLGTTNTTVADLAGISQVGDKVVADMDANSLLQYWTQARALIVTDLQGRSELGDKIVADMDANSILAHGTYGLSALHTDIGAVVTTSLVIKSGTVATASTARSFTLSAAFPAVANAYPRGTVLTFTDATTGQTYWGAIRGYTAGRVVTLYQALPAAPEAADTVNIWPFAAQPTDF